MSQDFKQNIELQFYPLLCYLWRRTLVASIETHGTKDCLPRLDVKRVYLTRPLDDLSRNSYIACYTLRIPIDYGGTCLSRAGINDSRNIQFLNIDRVAASSRMRLRRRRLIIGFITCPTMYQRAITRG